MERNILAHGEFVEKVKDAVTNFGIDPGIDDGKVRTLLVLLLIARRKIEYDQFWDVIVTDEPFEEQVKDDPDRIERIATIEAALDWVKNANIRDWIDKANYTPADPADGG